MKFLADENVEQPVVEALRAAGHDVLAAGEVAPGSSDEKVLDLANTAQRLIITNDRDFGEMAFRGNRASEGIVLLRFDAQSGPQKASLLCRILPQVEHRLAGSFAVITESRVRLRPLLKQP